MINSVLQTNPISIAEVGIVFLFAFLVVGLSVFGILAANRERWLNIRKIPYKKFIIDVPGNSLVKIIPKAGESKELKILGKKRTYLSPTGASKDGVIFHYDYDNSNPKITLERRSWKAPPESWADKKKLPLFKDFYNSEEISRIISSKIFVEYQKAKVQVNANTFILILVGAGIAVSGYGVFQMSSFIEDLPQLLIEAFERALGGE